MNIIKKKEVLINIRFLINVNDNKRFKVNCSYQILNFKNRNKILSNLLNFPIRFNYSISNNKLQNNNTLSNKKFQGLKKDQEKINQEKFINENNKDKDKDKDKNSTYTNTNTSNNTDIKRKILLKKKINEELLIQKTTENLKEQNQNLNKQNNNDNINIYGLNINKNERIIICDMPLDYIFWIKFSNIFYGSSILFFFIQYINGGISFLFLLFINIIYYKLYNNYNFIKITADPEKLKHYYTTINFFGKEYDEEFDYTHIIYLPVEKIFRFYKQINNEYIYDNHKLFEQFRIYNKIFFEELLLTAYLGDQYNEKNLYNNLCARLCKSKKFKKPDDDFEYLLASLYTDYPEYNDIMKRLYDYRNFTRNKTKKKDEYYVNINDKDNYDDYDDYYYDHDYNYDHDNDNIYKKNSNNNINFYNTGRETMQLIALNLFNLTFLLIFHFLTKEHISDIRGVEGGITKMYEEIKKEKDKKKYKN